MIFFLDTNICIYFLNNSNHHLNDRLLNIQTSDVKIPSMVAAELLYGAEKSAKRERNLHIVKSFLSIYEIVQFDDRAAEYYADIRSSLERQGCVIGGNDMIIAATAMANDGTVVTSNTAEFSRVSGLIVEDWTEVDSV